MRKIGVCSTFAASTGDKGNIFLALAYENSILLAQKIINLLFVNLGLSLTNQKIECKKRVSTESRVGVFSSKKGVFCR